MKLAIATILIIALALPVLAWGGDAQVSAQQWEYKIIVTQEWPFAGKFPQAEDALNDAGRDGWKLQSVQMERINGDKRVHMFMMRPKQPPSK